MKKRGIMLFLVLVLLVLGACRETTTDTTIGGIQEETVGTNNDDTETETAGEETVVPVDVNANEASFVQTGEHEESVTLIGTGGADPSTIVVDLGDLVTLEVYSERVQSTELYNEDLLVDVTIERGKTGTVTIEANEEGVFYITDKTTGEQLFRFYIAGTSFG